MVGGNHLGAIHAPSIARVGVVARITGKHAQVHDGPGELVDEIDHLGDRRSGGGADGDKRARSDDRAVAGFVKESPDETGLVLVVQVGSDVDGGHPVFLDPASLDPRLYGCPRLRFRRAEDQLAEGVRCFGLHSREHVLVDGHREGGCGVAKALAYDLHGDAGLQEQRRMGMAKIM